jgi:sigma-B regulation protein RsbU (phosphoserine phosphatase)
VRTLRGIVPICSFCKKIRNDKGYWDLVEVYVKRHTEAEFSHGICPECLKKHYPEFEA